MSSYKKLGESKGWTGYSLDSFGGKLVTIGAGGFYHIDPETGDYKQINKTNWAGHLLTSTNYQLMAINYGEKGGVYSIDFETGEYKKLSDSKWHGYIVDGLNDCLFAIGEGGVYKIFEDGTYKQLSKSNWKGYSTCNVERTYIYALGEGGFYTINTEDGSSKKTL